MSQVTLCQTTIMHQTKAANRDLGRQTWEFDYGSGYEVGEAQLHASRDLCASSLATPREIGLQRKGEDRIFV
jgi:hypothetical protein